MEYSNFAQKKNGNIRFSLQIFFEIWNKEYEPLMFSKLQCSLGFGDVEWVWNVEYLWSLKCGMRVFQEKRMWNIVVIYSTFRGRHLPDSAQLSSTSTRA
jgi:hypothetical protein